MPLVIPLPLRRQIDSTHGNRVAAALAPLNTHPNIPMPTADFTLLCFTNRCGSNYLAALLASTGKLPEAGEILNADTILTHAPAAGGSLRAYIANLPNLIPIIANRLAAKASIDQLMMLTDAGILDEILPRTRFILLERKDRLAQAISRSIAAQTGRWTTAHRPTQPETTPQYSRDTITAEIARITLATYGFQSFFATNQIAPVHLLYEDLVANPTDTIADIGHALGLGTIHAHPAFVRIARQADAVNVAWRARYSAGE